jgi:hypothetical protein
MTTTIIIIRTKVGMAVMAIMGMATADMVMMATAVAGVEEIIQDEAVVLAAAGILATGTVILRETVLKRTVAGAGEASPVWAPIRVVVRVSLASALDHAEGAWLLCRTTVGLVRVAEFAR